MESQRTQEGVEGVSIEEVVLQEAVSAAKDQLSSLLAKAYPFLATVYLVKLTQSLILATVAAAEKKDPHDDAVVAANAP